MNLTQETIGEFLKFLEDGKRLFFIDEVREWLRQYDKEEISFSKFVELFNLKFFRWYKAEAERAAIVEAEKETLQQEFENSVAICADNNIKLAEKDKEIEMWKRQFGGQQIQIKELRKHNEELKDGLTKRNNHYTEAVKLLQQLTAERDAYKEALIYIKRYAEKINSQTWQNYKEQILIECNDLQKFNNTNQTKT